MLDEHKLKQNLDTLDTLSRDLILILLEGKNGDFNSKFYQYKELRAEILLELVRNYSIPVIKDPRLRTQLKEFIKNGDKFIASSKKHENKGIRNFTKEIDELLKPDFKQNQLDDIEFELFYNKYDPTEYVYRLIETGLIVIKNIEFPDNLKRLILELRECLALKNYLAASIMLRTIAEVAVDDVIERKFEGVNLRTYGERLEYLENQSGFSISAGSLNAYRKELNEYVHGKKLADSKFINQYVDIILEQIEKLYEKIDYRLFKSSLIQNKLVY